MIKFLKHNFQAVLLITTLFLVSCEDEDTVPDLPVVGEEGFFIVNEGGWGHGNTSLSFYDRTTGTVANDIFYTANNDAPLGDQAQSMAIEDTLGYIMVQNSGKIEVIDINSFKSVATIDDGIVSPRYFIAADDNKAYVSDWGDRYTSYIKIIDLTNHTVTDSIQTGAGTNEMIIQNDKLYAVNAGASSRDNTLVVIDISSDQVLETIEIADNPNSLQIDADGNIWILTSGYTAYDENWNIDLDNSTKGALIQISTSGEELSRFDFPEFSDQKHLNISQDGQMLYFIYQSEVYAMDIVSDVLPSIALIEKSFYGLAIDPINGNIIGCEATSFTGSGNLIIYSAAGTLLETHAVGIAPNGCTFK